MHLINWIEILALTAFGLTVAYIAGTFRRKSILPPRRLLTDRSSSLELLLPALAGFCASLFAPSIYFALVVGKDHQPTSHQTVCEYALSAAAGLLMIQCLDILQQHNRLKSRQLPEGIFFGVVGGLAIIPLVNTATSLIQEIMRRFGAAPPQEHSLLIVFQQPSGTDRLLVILSAVVLAPLFEELAFRAHIQSAIRKFTSMPWLAVIVTSALFALVHGIWWMMPPLFVLAVGLGYVYERTRNIWATITIHAAFNALSLAVEYISMKHH